MEYYAVVRQKDATPYTLIWKKHPRYTDILIAKWIQKVEEY